MKRDPLPSQPTHADLARGITDAHDCIHAIGQRLDESVAEAKQRDHVIIGRLEKQDTAIEAIRVGQEKARNDYLTMVGQNRAVRDDSVITDEATSERLDVLGRRMEVMADRIEAIGLRVGVNHVGPSILTISAWKLVAGAVTVFGAMTAIAKMAPIAPALFHALAGR